MPSMFNSLPVSGSRCRAACVAFPAHSAGARGVFRTPNARVRARGFRSPTPSSLASGVTHPSEFGRYARERGFRGASPIN